MRHIKKISEDIDSDEKQTQRNILDKIFGITAHDDGTCDTHNKFSRFLALMGVKQGHLERIGKDKFRLRK